MIKNKTSISMGTFFKNGVNVNIGDTSETVARFINVSIPLSAASEHSFSIFFEARNGTWSELLKINVDVNGKQLEAIQVRRRGAFPTDSSVL